MGHSRLGKLPKTKQWNAVVATFAGADPGADGSNFTTEVSRIATEAMKASAGAVKAARSDGGVAEIFFILTQIALAARRQNTVEALERLDIRLPAAPSALDVTIEVHRIIDDRLDANGRRTDIGEMAQLAVGEALASYLRAQPRDMFADPAQQLHRNLKGLGTQKAFGQISHEFFGGLTARLLGFNLSRLVRAGGNSHLIGDADDLTRFNAELRLHSRQRAEIVRDFAARWFSKREFEEGITRDNCKRFVAHALKKLEDEFKQGATGE